RQYTGINTVVSVAGRVDPRCIVDAAGAALGGMPRGDPNVVVPPAFMGGVRARRLPGGDHVDVVLGFPVPALPDEDDAFRVAAADLFALGRIRSQEELLSGIASVGEERVRDAFARMLDAGAAVGVAGKIARGVEERVARLAPRR